MDRRSLGLASMLALLGACGSSENGSAGEPLEHYLVGVKSGDGTVAGQLRSGSLPSGGGSSLQAATTGALLPGASSLISVTSSSAVDHILVGVQGAAGYYELKGIGAASQQQIIVSLSQTTPTSFSFLVAGGSGDAVGSTTSLPVTLTPVGTGDIQITLTWDVDSDVDLHVLDPNGEEIYYGHPSSASGGKLDLDSNAGCDLDHKRAENITWPTGTAPQGWYIILIDYWDACGQAETHALITYNIKDQTRTLYSGAAGPYPQTGSGDRGEQCFARPQPEVCGEGVVSFMFD